MNKESNLVRPEIDGIDELFATVMQETKSASTDMVETSEIFPENKDESMTAGHDSPIVEGLLNRGFQVRNQVGETEADNRELDQLKDNAFVPPSTGTFMENDIVTKASHDLPEGGEKHVGNIHEEEERASLEQKSDEPTLFIHLNNRGHRHFKKQIGTFVGLEDHFIEYSKVDLPAHKAAWDGNVDALEQVFFWKIAKGVPSIDRHGATPLHLAARRNQVNVIRWLMKYSDLSVMHQASRGETPVHVAAALGHSDSVKALLASEEKDVKYILSYLQDRLGFTCLLLAIHKHQNVTAKILIDELGIRAINTINETGINSAHVAAAAGNVEVLKIIHSKHRKLLHQKARDGTTPVYFAAQEGRLQALQYLHDDANCDLMIASEDGLKPIHAACQTGHTSIVKFIVNRLGHVAMKNVIIDGASPLHFASAAGKVKTALWLLKNDPSKNLLNGADLHGDTPLHDAIESSHFEMARILVEHGADLYAANKFGKTPYSLAMESDNSEIYMYIQEFVTRKSEEEEAANQMSIFDMKGTEEVVNLDDEPAKSIEYEEIEMEEQNLSQSENESTENVSMSSRIFKDKFSVLSKRPSLKLWPPMPTSEDSEDDEFESSEHHGLENIAEEDESDEYSQDEDKAHEPDQDLNEHIDDQFEEDQLNDEQHTTKDLIQSKHVEVNQLNDEQQTNVQGEQIETDQPNDEQCATENYAQTDEEHPNHDKEHQLQSDSQVVEAISDSIETPVEDEDSDRYSTNINIELEESQTMEVVVEDSQIKNEYNAEESFQTLVTDSKGVEPDYQNEQTENADLQLGDKANVPENASSFSEVKLRKTVVAKGHRRSSDPDFRGAGPELKQIFRFRKNMMPDK